MNSIFNTLTRAMDHYRTVQDEQMASFDRELMPDLKSLSFKRNQAYAELKNHLINFLNAVQCDTVYHVDTVRLCMEKLDKIMEKDKKLSKSIRRHRDDIRHHMCKTGETRAAFSGYVKTGKTTE